MKGARPKHYDADPNWIIVSFEARQTGAGTIRGNRPLLRLVVYFLLGILVSLVVVESILFYETGRFNVSEVAVRSLLTLIIPILITLWAIIREYSRCSFCEYSNSVERESSLCQECWKEYQLDRVSGLAEVAKREFFDARKRGVPPEVIEGRYKRAMKEVKGE